MRMRSPPTSNLSALLVRAVCFLLVLSVSWSEFVGCVCTGCVVLSWCWSELVLELSVVFALCVVPVGAGASPSELPEPSRRWASNRLSKPNGQTCNCFIDLDKGVETYIEMNKCCSTSNLLVLIILGSVSKKRGPKKVFV